MTADVLIVGGGAIGLALADVLALEGVTVRLIEGASVGAGASGAAAGMLAPVNEASSPGPLFALGCESLRRFAPLCERLTAETGIDPELEASGLARVVRSEAERVEQAARLARLAGAFAEQAPPGPSGSLARWVERDDLVGEIPGLSVEVPGAFVCNFECHVRPPRLVRALEVSARSRGVAIESGVRVAGLLVEGRRVRGVETSAGRREAGAVVLAAGPWTMSLLPDGLGEGGAPAIEPVRGQIASLAAPLPAASRITAGEGVYCVPKRDGSWVVGATESASDSIGA